ncbi:Alpha/Beta hydrolase protein [Phycomyces nitens]|nr:Alpha/Beta hydrolase protein [Phycomyces nitens]
MVPDTAFTRSTIYFAALAQTAIAPVAFVHYVYYIATESLLFALHPSIDLCLHYWLGAELIFYVYFQITHNRMQQSLAPVFPSAKERRILYYNCLENVEDVQVFLPGWFMHRNNPSVRPPMEDICRDNLAEWIAWGFFSSPLEHILEDQALTDELYGMIDGLQHKFNVQLKPGYDEDIQSFRLSLDPVVAYYRPLFFYLAIMLLTHAFGFVLQMWGMSKYGPETQSTLTTFLEPQESWRSINRLTIVPERVSYWFRDGDRQNKKPIVFIHGLGAGLMCYCKFIYALLTLDCPVFCVELPYVAMRCTEDVPTMQETVRDIERMLHRHHFQDAVFVAHSLGTAVTSWSLKLIPRSICGVVMLDPICFMLHYRDVCGNFVYRLPTTAGQCIIKYFASSELYISYYISRHFHWFQTALYVTPKVTHNPSMAQMTTQMPQNIKVFLSENDSIVDSLRVDRYLTHHGVDSVVMEGLEHASFLFYNSWGDKILKTINDFTNI